MILYLFETERLSGIPQKKNFKYKKKIKTDLKKPKIIGALVISIAKQVLIGYFRSES